MSGRTRDRTLVFIVARSRCARTSDRRLKDVPTHVGARRASDAAGDFSPATVHSPERPRPTARQNSS
ncbi:hypothetical protein C8Q78DRAFT_1021040 [Trametes maxima]|nr:hypothetical protein C8Q78DRAFT_1021040 [Trametes maxima]